MPKYELKSNQYIPRKAKMLPSGMPGCATYYYVVNEDNKVINKHTTKTYRGKQMLNYAFHTIESAEAFLKTLK